VSRICQEIDQQVQAFLSRPLQEAGYACVYLDATYLKGRLGKALQVCSRAVVVAMGVNVDGRRELPGLKVGDSETEGFWSEFIASLKERGLTGMPTGGERRPRRPDQGHPQAAAGLRLAALSPSFRQKPVAAGAQGPSGHGHRRPAQCVRPGER